MSKAARCEVLNVTYEPLSIVSGRRALILCLKGKAKAIEHHPIYYVKSEKEKYFLPTKILLFEMVKRRPEKMVQLTQRNLFTRDCYKCQYCLRHRLELKEREFLTRDHVVPRASGGLDVWTNTVTACNRCNHKKADRKLSDCGLKLINPPHHPTRYELWAKRDTKTELET